MRILYLTNAFPYPLTSGYLRQYFLIKELSQRHEITLLSLTGPDFVAEHKEALAPFTCDILTFSSGRKKRSVYEKAIRRIAKTFRPDPAVQAMRGAVERLVQEKQFDVCISGKRVLAAVKPLLAANIPLVADLCDATSARVRRSMTYASVVRLPFLLLEYVQMRQAEREMMQLADHNIFISYRDLEDALVNGQASPTTIVPNGVDLTFWQRSSRTLGRNTIAFTGAMGYRPNTDAALYLIQEILPIVARSVPDVQLLIVGKEPTPALIEAGKHPNVTVTGFVDDVRPYLERATVFAAPLRFGAGMQNKVLEAMAMEVPVVASSLAADGLRTGEGRRPPIQIADDREQFAEVLVTELRRRLDNPEPDTRARRFIEDNYVWDWSGTLLEQVLARVVDERNPARVA